MRLALAGFAALYLLLAGVRAWDRTHPYYDDVGFLDLGNQARELGGPVALVKALYSGAWREDNRNPLYAGVLSLIAGRDHGYHARAMILNILLGLLALLAWWRTAEKHLGARAALIVAAFLSMSECFIDYAGRESCEPLLLLLWALAIGAILDGKYILAGLWAGLAQLDKGSGVFIVVCFAIALLVWRGWPALRDAKAWGMGLAFLAAASPLLVRNLRDYGSPLHHWNNRLFWIDRLPDYAETYAPHAFDRLPDGFRQWAAHTSWHEIWFGRGVMGLGETAVHLGDSMSFVAPQPLGAVHLPGVLFGLVLMIVALRLLWRSQPSFARTFLLVQSALFIAVFFFFSVAGGSSRYVFPMTLCLYCVLAKALAERPDWLKRWAAAGAACTALALALDPSTRKLPEGYAEAGAWLEQNLKPGESYAVDSRSHFEPEWFLPASNRMEIVSQYWQRQPLPESELLDHFQSRGVRYAIVDLDSNKDGAPRHFLLSEAAIFSAGPLRIVAIPPALRPAIGASTGEAPAGAPAR